ncbi:Flp pilus assembly protein CpaB [Blastomonas sp. SL216]|jgi:pilus assembly protein CpaB|uniref:Flp pilus assembly protein CpaB n=1 Tax=Blastomonas sp. SL216 TaxID=2995169 RepID=UPI00237785CB|nr:Flp pilus assembly protein CpaB [Blastomonas sp. SL216]
MDKRKVILLVGALVIALCTAFLARSLFTGSAAPEVTAAPQQAVPTGPRVLVANRSLPVGTIITPDSVAFQPWPSELVSNAYFLEADSKIDSLLGTVVRNAVTAGQPVTQGSLVKPGDRGFLAAALGPGMRAVTVPVSARTGVAGFVFPGDRVDLVLTQTVGGDGEGPALNASETIIRNLRVLATDQRVTAENAEGKPEVIAFTTVTVEATPKLAEKIAVAQTIGTLSLSLRSIADNEAELERSMAAGDIKLPEGADRKTEDKLLKAFATRPVDTDPTYVTGGDVSRFQRRSVPSMGGSRRQSEYNGPAAPGGAPQQVIAPAAPPVPSGPVVRVARGNTVTEVPVGGK